jgi:beta-glucanase (GH16 family)
MKKIILIGFAAVAFYARSQYVLVWSDEFESTALDMAKWRFDLGGGGWGNNESQYYTSNSSNIKVENGMLNITAREEQIGNWPYTSARITTRDLFFRRYGKAEARIKLPLGQGLWPAFWMLGANISTVGWPQCGEIDIMEHVSNDPEIHGTIHWNNNGHVSFGDGTGCSADEFHVYSIEWDQNGIKWFLDGVQYMQANIQNSINNTEEFHNPFYFLLNMAVGGNWPGYPDNTTVFPADMFVDYVRFYVTQADGSM